MKNSRDVVYKRQQKIIQKLNFCKMVKVYDLCKEFSVNAITIRRDLAQLEEKGIIKRFHGGAYCIDGAISEDPSLIEATNTLLLKKHAIAKMAAKYVEDGDTIFINSSSTALLVMSYIGDKRVVIVTNNGKALNVHKPQNVELVMTGGYVYERKQSLVGEFAVSSVSKIVASKCFIGISGIMSGKGITTSVLQETSINRAMLTHCNGPRCVLADSSKIGRIHNFISGEINLITNLITDSEADANEISLLQQEGVFVEMY